MPWAPLLLVPMATAWRRDPGTVGDASAAIRRLLWIWIAVIVVFFSTSASKEDLYIFPSCRRRGADRRGAGPERVRTPEPGAASALRRRVRASVSRWPSWWRRRFAPDRMRSPMHRSSPLSSRWRGPAAWRCVSRGGFRPAVVTFAAAFVGVQLPAGRPRAAASRVDQAGARRSLPCSRLAHHPEASSAR